MTKLNGEERSDNSFNRGRIKYLSSGSLKAWSDAHVSPAMAKWIFREGRQLLPTQERKPCH